ncbi:MAG TPA: PDZ domain-containing protein, partial [Burkholderiales bacterium]
MNQRTWRGSQALRHIVPGVLVLVAALLPGCAHRARTLPDTAAVAASSGLPYGGFALGTDAQGAALIADVIAGPAALAGLAPGDRIDAVAGEKVGAARLLEILQASPPGTRLPLRVVRDGRVLPIEF